MCVGFLLFGLIIRLCFVFVRPALTDSVKVKRRIRLSKVRGGKKLLLYRWSHLSGPLNFSGVKRNLLLYIFCSSRMNLYLVRKGVYHKNIEMKTCITYNFIIAIFKLRHA